MFDPFSANRFAKASVADRHFPLARGKIGSVGRARGRDDVLLVELRDAQDNRLISFFIHILARPFWLWLRFIGVGAVGDTVRILYAADGHGAADAVIMACTDGVDIPTASTAFRCGN